MYSLEELLRAILKPLPGLSEECEVVSPPLLFLHLFEISLFQESAKIGRKFGKHSNLLQQEQRLLAAWQQPTFNPNP